MTDPQPHFGAAFLAQPDLFPARQTGEPWGPHRVVLRFAGNDYAISGLSAAQHAALRERFGAMCADTPEVGRPLVALRVFRAPPSDFIGHEDDWEYDFALDYAPDAVLFAGFRFMGRLDGSPALRAALWTCEDGLMVANAILENVLRVVAAYHLLGQGGVLLHSAAVTDGHSADVFFGRSGAGKSTVSRQGVAAGRAVLSDDMNALMIAGDKVFVERLPFAGDFGHARQGVEGRYPVRSVSILEQGPAPALRAVAPAQAISALIGCASFVNRNPFRFEELAARLQRLHALVPVRVLTFAPDPGFWPLLDPQ